MLCIYMHCKLGPRQMYAPVHDSKYVSVAAVPCYILCLLTRTATPCSGQAAGPHVQLLCRASPPLAQCKLVYMFERLSYLPRVGALTATAIESIVLYGPWVTATAAVAPAEADNMLDQFNYFWHTGELDFPLLWNQHCQDCPGYRILRGHEMP